MFASTTITVRFQWAATHRWEGAKGRHIYLRHPHRHLFKGEAEIEVRDDDREVEFLELLDILEIDVVPLYRGDIGMSSCEHVAKGIAGILLSRYGEDRSLRVSVFEDGENGATVRWTP